MDALLDAIAAVVFLVSPEKVRTIATRIRQTDRDKATSTLAGVVGTPLASGLMDQLINAWRVSNASADELASMLLAAGHVFTKAANQQSTELYGRDPSEYARAFEALYPTIEDRRIYIEKHVSKGTRL